MASTFNEIDLKIRLSNAQSTHVRVPLGRSVPKLKSMIREDAQLPLDQHITLMHHGKVLRDDKTLSHYTGDLNRVPVIHTLIRGHKGLEGFAKTEI